MTPEFDGFGQEYRRLLKHPIRDWFAPSGLYFVRRKLEVMQAFFAKHGLATQNLRWLDVGCGQGDLLRLGRGEFKEVAGCDPSPEMLRCCADLPVRVQTSADELPYAQASFDLATLVCVLHHVASPYQHRLLNRVAGTLRPGGWLCLVEHNPFNPVTRYIVRRSPVDRGARLLRAAAAARLLQAQGFEVVERRYFLVVPERFARIFRPLEDRLGSLPLGGQYAVFARLAAPSRKS
ncbi:MAG: class I SAM-dependent methyltransferase [Pirellulales bacterium]